MPAPAFPLAECTPQLMLGRRDLRADPDICSKLEAQQILDQVAFLVISESQVHTAVVVVDDGIQISEAPVVIEAALKWVDSAPIGEVR